MRVYLVGFMGAGKTTVGRELAEALRVPFVDLDREVERRARKTVAEIFRDEGEAAFRRLERAALEATAEQGAAIVATGGGLMADAANRRFLRRHGLTVWLRPDLESLLARGRRAPESERPLFGDEDAVRALYRSRLDGYRQADIEVEVAPAEDPQQTVRSVLRRLEERRCGT